MSRLSWHEDKAMAEAQLNELCGLIENFTGCPVVVQHFVDKWVELHIGDEDNSFHFVGSTWKDLYWQLLTAKQTVEIALKYSGR